MMESTMHNLVAIEEPLAKKNTKTMFVYFSFLLKEIAFNVQPVCFFMLS